MTSPGLKIFIDRDLERAGFNVTDLQSDDVSVAYTERLSAVATLTVVITYLGGRLLNKATDGALARPIDTLLNFARSKEARLRIEFEERNFDPRIKIIMARIESVDRHEFQKALEDLPSIGPRANHLLTQTPEYISEMYFAWNGEQWVGTYYLTEGGDPIDF